MALSDFAVRQARATRKAYTLADSDGLSLAVTAAGGKTWHFRYYWLNKQKRMSLGTYPEVTLREARACVMRRAPCWPSASIHGSTGSTSAPRFFSPTRTTSRRCTG